MVTSSGIVVGVTTDLATTMGTVESPVLEFKREAKDRNAIRKAVCALANDLVGAGGGDLVIGVAKDGSPHPVDTSDEALLTVAQIRDEGRILERPSMTVDRARYRGSAVIHVHVTSSPAPPVRFDGVAWVRPGPLTVRASAADLIQANVARRVDMVDALAERTVTDYPVPALREAILNALVHRTYEASNACGSNWNATAARRRRSM